MGTSSAVVIPCSDVAAEVDYFVALGWRVLQVFPADDPRQVILDGHGIRLLVRRGPGGPLRLSVSGGVDCSSASPSGVVIEANTAVAAIPPLNSKFSLTSGDEPWHVGRAGMHYRDLVPDRQGGSVIASHIRIPEGGPVPDYPHFHDVVFQLIFCHKGWVRLAYEGQGEPFVLQAGECVTQPPKIRHRVLESSDDLHVIEVGFPAEHMTTADHDFDFAAFPVDPDRRWDGQQFLRYTNDVNSWSVLGNGIRVSDTGVAKATSDRADVRLVEMSEGSSHAVTTVPNALFSMVVVLAGEVTGKLEGGNDIGRLGEGATVVIPVESGASFTAEKSSKLLLVEIDTAL
ncbi:MAG: cupin domain-containing protein [Ilumatobacteraceae bacterium]